jgi:hypothetical protein
MFFHASCSERRRCNRIGNLQKEDGGWVEDEVEKRPFITNHFSQLFRSSGNQNSQRLLDCVESKVFQRRMKACCMSLLERKLWQPSNLLAI